MLRLIWIASIHIRQFMRRYMPTNILLNAIRTRRGLKWGVPAMLLVLPYLYLASLCSALVDSGGPGWLNVLAIVCIWNAMKMAWIGPVAVVQLVRVRIAERRVHRRRTRETEPVNLPEESVPQSASTSSKTADAVIRGRM